MFDIIEWWFLGDDFFIEEDEVEIQFYSRQNDVQNAWQGPIDIFSSTLSSQNFKVSNLP